MAVNLFRVVTIDVEGNVEVQDWDVEAGDTVTKRLQAGVGGWFDVVALSASLDMWVNDEGSLIGLPVNRVATGVARRFGKRDKPYWGPVVFTGGADAEGHTLPLSDLMVNAVVYHARAVMAASV